MGAGAYVVVPSLFRPASVAAEAYDSVEQCAAKNQHSREDCQKAYDAAASEYTPAPLRYAKREDCDAEFGSVSCAPQPGLGNTGYFAPPWRPFS